ncbi:MAG: hypothetical protein KC983_10380 [Phycisphaerales bacterium]|nr:hypothetical protein [Phycisphaerales bacterium]
MMPSPHTRRGSAYLLVLTGSIAVAVAGLTAMHIARTARFATEAVPDQAQAQSLALSGLDHALFTIDNAIDTERKGGAAWRNAFSDGDTFGPYTLGDGTFSWTVKDGDDDGSIADDAADGLRVTATGTRANATYAVEARLEPSHGSTAVSSLGISVYADKIELDNQSTFTAEAAVGAIGDITIKSNATLIGDAECAGDISGSVSGTSTSNAPKREMPSASVFDYYLANGTTISFSLLPLLSGDIMLENALLSPANNPWGSENPEGIYIIDCNGKKITIRNCRIVGTLVLLNVDVATLDGVLNWEPAYAHFPALLCDGEVQCNLAANDANAVLDESNVGTDGYSVNFNPPSTPCRGQSDGTNLSDAAQLSISSGGATHDDAVHDDTYPNVIAGIVYVRDDCTLLNKSNATFEGQLIVTGDLKVENDTAVTMHYSAEALTTIPPGFETVIGGAPYLVPGSIVRVTTP